MTAAADLPFNRDTVKSMAVLLNGEPVTLGQFFADRDFGEGDQGFIVGRLYRDGVCDASSASHPNQMLKVMPFASTPNLSALIAIANFPITDPQNMDAVNMAAIARNALK